MATPPKNAAGSQGEAPGPDEIEARLLWLESLAEAPGNLVELGDEALLRLRKAAGRIALPSRLERRRFAQTRRKVIVKDKRQHDDAALEATSNRAMKRALAFPKAPAALEISDEHRAQLDEQARQRTKDKQTRHLLEPQSCYICKEDFTELHHHYDSMCSKCATLNWIKRNESADLTGRVALVTGSRVKIGYEIVLMLLRAGARVIATTRFACDAARRFEKEKDFGDWSERLDLRALDLRSTPNVEGFCAELLESETRLDFLIHNACQTVRRPPAYYEEMAGREDPAQLSAQLRLLLGNATAEKALAIFQTP
ncbi:MAG: hypothetical protein ACI8PQ_003307, partial [Planctomycetota bacterium]